MKYGLLLCTILISSCSIFRTDPNACVVCHGIGKVHKACGACHSTGKCYPCNGFGFIDCSFCTNGGNYIDKKWQKCNACQGIGNKICYMCGGRGYCPICKSEYVTCMYCKGTGNKYHYSYENK